jgi:NADPH:quinone reductase-like Zn-dependent oxidoreductase
MRAMVTTALGDPSVLQIQNLPDPTPEPGDLLVEVHAAALNPIDTKLRRVSRTGLAKPPFVGGYDVSGVVRAVGSGITAFKPGDAVYASPAIHRNGAFAELVAVDHRTAAHKPGALSHEEAAALPLVTLTAWESLHRRARIKAGDTVLITAGAGGVGHVAIQIAKLAGCEVFTTASSPASIELCEQMGADEVINYREEDFAQAILNETNGRGVHAILDCVGGDTFARCPDAVAINGHIVPIVPGEIPQSLVQCFMKNVSVHFEFMGANTAFNANPAYQGQVLKEVATLADAGKLKPHLFKTYALEDLPAAHLQQETAHTIGKLVIKLK